MCLGEARWVFVKAVCGSWVVTQAPAAFLNVLPVPEFPQKSF